MIQLKISGVTSVLKIEFTLRNQGRSFIVTLRIIFNKISGGSFVMLSGMLEMKNTARSRPYRKHCCVGDTGVPRSAVTVQVWVTNL